MRRQHVLVLKVLVMMIQKICHRVKMDLWLRLG